MKKTVWIPLVLVAAISFSAGSAAAFGDVDPKKGEAILALKERGIVSGVGGDRFAPDQDMTYAEGLSLVMKGLLQGAVGEREADPTAGPWYAGLVEQAKTVGLLFRPASTLPRPLPRRSLLRC
ncbi:S-layer homology domain-containing protein [Paenibacillus sp. CC-CFT747]|nr:S-layer homology domain-containing protein [Paenibacillus sp. CC-CFT747]